MRRRPALLVLAFLPALACGGVEPWWEPAALSPAPASGTGRLRAGLARVDITPPTGVGLAGNGPEGAPAAGYRMRLYARALVLEDSRGERIALVSADLPHVSALLHRRVARLTVERGIGVDRLLLSATHTHSAPGHFYESAAYNESASSVPGFDREILDSLSARIARAVSSAADSLVPARAAWGVRAVWGQTRIRSLPAMRRNRPPPTPTAVPPDGLDTAYRLVDPNLTMLRVDRWDRRAGTYRPAGAWSAFAMHGTGNSPTTTLLDADLQGIVARLVERHIDLDLNRDSSAALAYRAVHVLANGAQGDVSPDWLPASRCAPPWLQTERRPDGPFVRPLWEWSRPQAAEVAVCRDIARRVMLRVGGQVAGAAIALFDDLGAALDDTLTIQRSFVTLRLAESADRLGICRSPLAGMSSFGGGPDARTRFYGWRWLGVFLSGMEESRRSPRSRSDGCHAQKRLLLWEGAANLIVATSLPTAAQLVVTRIGSRLLAGVPAEVTTTAARRMRAGMLEAARPGAPEDAVVVSLTNGFLQYVTTAEEYTAQYYEGGSTLYGPGEAEMLRRSLAELTRTLAAGDSLPAWAAPGIRADPGRARGGDRARGDRRAAVDATWCSRDTLYARVALDRRGGWLVQRAGEVDRPLVEIWRVDAPGADSARVAVDDEPGVELHRLMHRRDHGSWELRWSPAGTGDYLVRVHGAATAGERTRCGG